MSLQLECIQCKEPFEAHRKNQVRCPPCKETNRLDHRVTRRDKFAMAALQGLLSGFDGEQLLKHSLSRGPARLVSSKAVECADALIAELDKGASMNKRQDLIDEVKTWDRSYRSDGEPNRPNNRFRDEMIEHLEGLSDEKIEKITDIYSYDYKE